MKNYIFLNTTIANIGGAELYISHKCDHLKELGYNVYVFTFERGNVVINNLKVYEKYVLPELKILFRRSNAMIRRKVLNVFRNLNLDGETIIESNIDNLNVWGEYIAKEIDAYHICYLLPENNTAREKERDFYRYKYEQHVLFGITPHSIKDMMKDGQDYPNSFLPAVGCTADTIDYDSQYEIKGWQDPDYTILTLGRLNKPYIPSMLNSVCDFACEHKDKMVNLLIIGGYMSSDIEKKLIKIQNAAHNLKIYNLGEMSPIPQSLFAIADVAIAVAGCAYVCHGQGLPVITVDANDYKGIGLFKQTTINNTFRREECIVEVKDLLADVLVYKTFTKHKTNVPYTSKQIDYSKHDELLSIPSNIKYFDVSHKADSIVALMVKIAILLLGYERYFKMIDKFKRYVKK